MRAPWGGGTGVPALTGTRAGGAFFRELPSGRARCPAPPLALCSPRGPPFLPPPCPSSPPGFKLDGFRRRAGRSSHPSFRCLVSGSVRPDCWRRSLHAERRGHPATSLRTTQMFEEPEWAEEASLAAGLRPVASRPRPAAACQVKVSGPPCPWEPFKALKRMLVGHSAGHAARALRECVCVFAPARVCGRLRSKF